MPFLVALLLTCIALWRADFSPDAIASPLLEQEQKEIDLGAWQQPYQFLGEGRQSVAFVSQDGKWVLKFFKRRYFQIPWYVPFLWDPAKEIAKREKRKDFFLHSYSIAEQDLKEETGIVFLHFGKTTSLPTLPIKDRASRLFSLDLNGVPFVLQKRGEPFYPGLQKRYETEGEEGLILAISDFLTLIDTRIKLGIQDADHDVEHNFGFLDGKPFHLDPGRFSRMEEVSQDIWGREWWSATHSLRKWLSFHHPQMIPAFDKRIEQLLIRGKERGERMQDSPNDSIW